MSNILADISTDYPETSELLSSKKPYYLKLINMIKKFGYDNWPRFLKMLYDTVEEIKEYINKGV